MFKIFIKQIKFMIKIANLNYYLIRLEYNLIMEYLKKLKEDLR
jgi:hypothetical protein